MNIRDTVIALLAASILAITATMFYLGYGIFQRLDQIPKYIKQMELLVDKVDKVSVQLNGVSQKLPGIAKETAKGVGDGVGDSTLVEKGLEILKQRQKGD